MRTSISYQSIHNYTVRNNDTIPNQGIEKSLAHNKQIESCIVEECCY